MKRDDGTSKEVGGEEVVVKVRFMSLVGKFQTSKEETFASLQDATRAVEAYATAAGYSNVRIAADDYETDGIRWTARTPGGRGGRNVAFADDVYGEE